MALETGTYINSLITTNPVAGDPISQGDDHIRLLKATIKSTFPNLTGAVTANQDELNQLAGLELMAALGERLLTADLASSAAGKGAELVEYQGANVEAALNDLKKQIVNAEAAMLSRGLFATTAKALSKGVVGVASLVGGTGGANGTFDLAFSGGGGSGAAGRFVVAGGAVVSVMITSTGDSYTSAPTISFAASSGLTGASATAVIANNVDVGEYFSVPVPGSVDSFILYLVDSGPVATEVCRYASADATKKPAWAGKKNGWPDTFFRRFDLTSQTFLGRDRWFWNGWGAGAFAGWSRVANALFDGYALRRENGYNQTSFSGPTIWLNEIDVAAGDTVTACVLITGASGGDVYSAYRFTTDDELVTVSQGSMLSPSGANKVVASATPQLLRISAVVPANATRLNLYPLNLSGDTGFDVVAVWAFKGDAASGPAWPSLHDSYFDLRDAQFETRVGALEAGAVSANPATHEIRNAVVPYVMWGHPRGDSEMDGEVDYGYANAIGCYEQLTEASIINAMLFRIWASQSVAVEWKLWIRDSATPFNMNSTPAEASGTVAAGAFPTANTIYKLRLPSRLSVAAGKYVFVMFRAVNDSALYLRRWTTDSSSPARHGWPMTTTGGGWNQTFGISFPPAYCQAAAKFLLESDEVKSLSVSGSNVSFNGTSCGIAATDLQAALAEIAGTEMVAPSYVFGVQGREANVYFDNLFLGDASDYAIEVNSSASLGTHQNERWTWTPGGAVAAGSLTISAHQKNTGQLITSKTIEHRAAAANAGSGLTKKVMVIGDSLVNAGIITQTLLDIAASDVMGVTLLGTRGSGSNKHEGRGGYTVNDYATAGRTYYTFTVSGIVTPPEINSTEYSHNGSVYRVQELALTGGAGTITCSVTSGGAPLANGTLTKSSGSGDASIAFSASAAVSGNPFWKSGAVNFAQYLADNAIAAPDWVFIALGINDVGNSASDAAALSAIATAFGKLDTLVASIKAAGAGIKVGLVIPPPGSAHQDAFGANYGTGLSRWRFKRNILLWAKQMIATYSGQEANRIYVVPSNTALDTVNNMSRGAAAGVNSRNSTVTKARQSNGVHPDTSGYEQIADAAWAFLKFYA